jgi:hypothetical protein
MRTLEDVLNQLAYHPATPDVSAKYARMREIAMEAARESWELIPDGPEKTTAMRGLQQFLINANLAIALSTPADLATPHVARVLPGATGEAPPEAAPQQAPGADGTPAYRQPPQDPPYSEGHGLLQ